METKYPSFFSQLFCLVDGLSVMEASEGLVPGLHGAHAVSQSYKRPATCHSMGLHSNNFTTQRMRP
ncbi:hypothetical protein JB92DRAFT_2855255 [Gautieria morchelliformis]|nr:hypothetical protein JB92DRAFT_2855255 [Gautieria morchelliformis]